ncbi:MAG: hypothetical protein ABW185_15900 [Sedimenticola sp.]
MASDLSLRNYYFQPILQHLADWLKIANIVASLMFVVFFATGPGGY